MEAQGKAGVLSKAEIEELTSDMSLLDDYGYFLIAVAVMYIALIGWWVKERAFNKIGFILICLQETAAFIFGLYLVYGFVQFKEAEFAPSNAVMH